MSHVSCLMPHDKNNYFYFIEKISKALKKKKKKTKKWNQKIKKKKKPPLPIFFFLGGWGGTFEHVTCNVTKFLINLEKCSYTTTPILRWMWLCEHHIPIFERLKN
jgi:hypothetical protein